MIKNEYEGYFVLIFNNPATANHFLLNYDVYEKYWIRKHLFGLLTNIHHDYQDIFQEFECIIMKKEPDQNAVLIQQEKIIIKLWFVCKLQENKLTDDQDQNKTYIINYLQNNLIQEFQATYHCQALLQYLEIAAEIQE